MLRLLTGDTEWSLFPTIFEKIWHILLQNTYWSFLHLISKYQISKCISCNPYQNSIIPTAFSITWTLLRFHPSLPFSLIGNTISKIKKKAASGIIYIPELVTQNWSWRWFHIYKSFWYNWRQIFRLSMA